MSTPEAPTRGVADASVSSTTQKLKNCWSCRLISGGGLMACGLYVFMGARKTMRQGGPTSFGTVAQITFASCLAAWGVVVLTDPVGKAQRKT